MNLLSDHHFAPFIVSFKIDKIPSVKTRVVKVTASTSPEMPRSTGILIHGRTSFHSKTGLPRARNHATTCLTRATQARGLTAAQASFIQFSE